MTTHTRTNLDPAGVIRVVKEQVRLATRHLAEHDLIGLYLREIPVEFSTRGRAGRAGRAGFYQYSGTGDIGRVVINTGVCYAEDRLTKVLFHELAHAVCHWVHADLADTHGPLWKAIMVQLGQEPERCHPYLDRK